MDLDRGTMLVETNSEQVTKMMSHHPIYCNLINDNPKTEIVPFSLTYTAKEGEPVVRPVEDPDKTMDELIKQAIDKKATVTPNIIGLLTGAAVIVLIVPIVLGIVNSRRVVT